jgi:hypothetical protein
MNSVTEWAKPDNPVKPEYTSNVTAIVFTRPKRSLIVPKMMPPVAQPIIMIEVAHPTRLPISASVPAAPRISRIAGCRASANSR